MCGVFAFVCVLVCLLNVLGCGVCCLSCGDAFGSGVCYCAYVFVTCACLLFVIYCVTLFGLCFCYVVVLVCVLSYMCVWFSCDVVAGCSVVCFCVLFVFVSGFGLNVLVCFVSAISCDVVYVVFVCLLVAVSSCLVQNNMFVGVACGSLCVLCVVSLCVLCLCVQCFVRVWIKLCLCVLLVLHCAMLYDMISYVCS